MRYRCHEDYRCGLAVEDRDLLAECQNADACLDTAAEVLFTLYPPVIGGGVVLVNPLAN